MMSYPQPMAFDVLTLAPETFMVPQAQVDAPDPLAITVRFGKRLRSLRLSAGRSPAEFAMQLNILRSRLERIENGLEEVDLVLLDRIATVLEMTMDDLLLGL